MRLIGISGSLRRDSHNTKLLRAAADALPPAAELVIWEGLREVPPYSEDDEHETPASVAEIAALIGESDGVLFATPEYNHSVPGQLKNLLDWLSRPTLTGGALYGKPAAVLGTSTGLFGAVWAQAELRKVLAALGAEVLDEEFAVGLADSAFEGDRLADPDAAGRLGALLDGWLAARV